MKKIIITMSLLGLFSWQLNVPAQASVIVNDLPQNMQSLANVDNPETAQELDTPSPTQQPVSTTLKPMRSSHPKKSKNKAQKRRSYWATAWVDQEDNTYRFGEPVTFFVKANRDAYITLLDVGTSGEVRVLFPNQLQPDHFVRKGQIIKIPGPTARFDIIAQPPAGVELIKIIATESPGPVLNPAYLKNAGLFDIVQQSPDALAKDLVILLRERHHSRWNTYNKVIRLTN